MSKVYFVKVELTAILQSQKVKRNSDFWPVAAPDPDSITVDLCNQPENLAKFIPRFILGKTRDHYKVSKVLEVRKEALGL